MTKPPEKSGDAFRTIREVADWLGVPTHVLRFWESKFDQIAPVKGAGGRRYYRPEDMRLLGGIKVMLHDDGLTIRAVSQRIEEAGVDSIMDLSPALEAGDPAPPQRTRRVIRKGDDLPAKPAEEPRAKPKLATSDQTEPEPVDGLSAASQAPPIPIAKDPAAPLDETLPEQPDTPELPDGSPDPGESLIEAPAPTPSEIPLDRSAPDDPATEPDSAPDDPPSDPASAPDDPSEPIHPTPDPLPDAPVDAPVPDGPAVAPQPDAPVETEPRATPDMVDPLGRARTLAQDARSLSPPERKRLRRIVRRYRALAEEIADDLAEQGAD